MECLLGIRFRDFTIVGADMTNAHSIMVMKEDEDKMFQLSENLLLAVSGESGDTTQFAEYIAKNIQLYKMRNGYDLNPVAAATFTRKNLADYLRSRTPYFVNMLMAGYDAKNGAHLYFFDYLGTMVPLPYGAHGYGGFFSLSVLDRNYRPEMTKEAGYDLMKKCVGEIHKRLIVNLPNFQVRIVDKDGITQMDPITVDSLKE